MGPEALQTGFDWGALDTETRTTVEAQDQQLDANMNTAGGSFLAACHNLLNIRQALKYTHPGFVEYCNSKAGLSLRTAYRMISVAEKFANLANISPETKRSTLYLMAARPTPEEAHDGAMELLKDAAFHLGASIGQNVVDAFKADDAEREEEPQRTLYVVPPQPEPEPERPHVAYNSGNNEWYTPPEYIEAARRVLGDIDLDPASSLRANQTVGARLYYVAEQDGLSFPWSGRVWMNPPYSGDLIGSFCSKFLQHYLAGDIDAGIVLVNNATETNWFQPLLHACSAVCFVRGRIRYLDATGVPALTPLQGQAILYFGSEPEEFVAQFCDFGEACQWSTFGV